MKAPTLKALPILAACALLGCTVAANASPYVVSLQEEGDMVVATGSGAIDLSGLEPTGNPSGTTAGVNASLADIATGPAGGFSGTAQYVPVSNNFKGPTSFGPGGNILADDGSGDIVSLAGAFQLVLVPKDYVSDTPLSDTSTYFLPDLGVFPGTFVWTWGPGADQSFTLSNGGEGGAPTTPLPGALPLSATGLGALGLLGWRKKRKGRVSLLGVA